MKLLSIDTSRETCSVALFDGAGIKEHISHEPRSHARLVAPFVADLLGSAGEEPVEGIVVLAGPGSYTGLRIGLASAKGLCLALGASLYAVSTLEVMAFVSWHEELAGHDPGMAPVTIVPRFRAREGEWYMGAYRMVPAGPEFPVRPQPQAIVPDTVVPESDISAWLSRLPCSSTPHETDVQASATWAARLVHEHPDAYLQADAATFEPYYLKEVAAKPRRGSIFDRLPSGGS